MQAKDQFIGSWTLYRSFGTCHEVNILHLCSFCIHKKKEYVNITLCLSDYAQCLSSVNS